jgi:hypothetical protein
MIEGIVICVLLIAALLFLHWLYDWNVKPLNPMDTPLGNLPPVTLKVPMPPVKPARKEAEQYERMRDVHARTAERKPAANTKYGVPYGSRAQSGGSSVADTDATLLAVVASDTIYDGIREMYVDTTPRYEYTSPTPSSYSEPSSSSWGGDSSSSSSSSCDSSSSSSSCD